MLDEKRITGEHLAPYLRNVDVQWDRINVENLPEMDFSGSDLVRYALTIGDLLVCEGGEVGRAAIWQGELNECYYQKALHRLRCWDPTSDTPRFMLYLLRAATSLNVFTASEGKSTIAHLTAETLRSYRFAFPPLHEQKQIVSFLDRETGKIDALIAEQEKLLTLLAEKRQATISQAVTRGLNPNAPMKDSGVAWLGEVPAHWKVRKASYDCDVLSGFAFPSAGFSLDDSGVKLLRGVNVGIGALRWDDVVYWNRVPNDGLDTFELRPGDIVLGMDRPWISGGLRVARVSDDDIPCLLLQRVAAIRTGTALHADYLYLMLQAGYFFDHCSPEMTGVSVPHISPEQIRSFVIPVPPFDEQFEIAAFVNTEGAKLDALRVEAQRSIELLKQRRSALIAAAVTGKIDVRGAVAQEQEELAA
ncbi:restriction endonuclease subunit S [Burkholderia pseudomallei]|uniref:restriction endonuclease subunit S n=1 Tax=Burkholderia pseudomallei TaxID=28450 RepID=UPI001E5FD1AB|nr:restriction endonuclease subunit S [Burkholderia pseudomallei]